MIYKKLLWSLLAITVLWSCSKDDGPSAPAPAGPPTIANFTPQSGPVGTEITINGTNFSTTVASNTVKIGTATATVTAATATQLKATVPTGATTGAVSVSVGGTTVTSGEFTVTDAEPVNQAPTADDQSFEVAEDVAEGEVIGTVEANDGDGDALTFELVTDESELFQVAENGEISLAEGKNLDFETSTEHSLTLSVSDGSNDPVEFTVTVTVTNVIESLFDDPASFILKFNMEAGEELEIGLNSQYQYDYTIDWGDGTEENYTTNANPTHTYDNTAIYTVAIKGIFPALMMDTSNAVSVGALIDVSQWGSQKWQRMNYAFTNCQNLQGFSATDLPNFSETTSMEGMFWNATQFNGDIGKWDISNVDAMTIMFWDAKSFNQDISGWNPESVTKMNHMFRGASSFNQDLSGWNVNNVTTFGNMFNGATSFNQSLASWEISSATQMGAMFDNSGMSPENLNATLIGWNNFVEANDGPKNITLGLDNLSVCGQEVIDATQNLGTNHQWTFTGNLGFQANCP
ncbi:MULTISPECIES: BspA family leucine-rich repeat surface protein [unclassified Allomuricauda]|uniref:BspA family leucine-rich repeat surface protein n=1 Tax=unclassified Allomuricauda TaxID=2615049 RepID=UPI00273D2128|nr:MULTISPECIES: BspA family leucine-rich repeat surface protein [unclassified Allomuricauda]